jgi:hypothetical protein
MNDTFIINVQDDSSDNESSSDSSSSVESDSELAQPFHGDFNYKHCNSLVKFLYLRGEYFRVG